MKRFNIDYEDRFGDLHHVWVVASNKEEAKAVARLDHWDIENIIQVYENDSH